MLWIAKESPGIAIKVYDSSEPRQFLGLLLSPIMVVPDLADIFIPSRGAANRTVAIFQTNLKSQTAYVSQS